VPVTKRFSLPVVFLLSADGKWRIEFAPMKAGGPYEIGITGQNAFLLKDIYVGEVWLGLGQSSWI
jgi:sialate O-acetylesterase